MKKFITFALAAAACVAAQAADVTVYNDGALAPGINVFSWWNCAYDFQAVSPTDASAKVFSFNAADGGTDASMGLQADGSTFVTGQLNSATLNFDWYATGTGVYTIRLTADAGHENNYDFTVTAENAGKWNTVALNVSETFPEVAADWKNYVGKGAGYVFSVIVSQASADAKIYLNNVYYSNIDEAWQAPYVPEIVPPTSVPAIAQPEDKVLSVYSAYGELPFNIGGWGQSTVFENITIDGKQLAKLTKFNYLGWEFINHFSVEGYDYMHVDFYPCEETTFGFTPISPGQEKGWIAPEVKINEWNSYDAPLSYFANVDFADIFQIKFDQGKNVECYLANVYFYKTDGGEDPDPDPDPEPVAGAVYSGVASGTDTIEFEGEQKEYPYTCKYTIVYNEDKTLTIKAAFEWPNGEVIGLVPGSVFINNELNDFTMADGVRTVTTTATYEAGEHLNLNFYLPRYAGVLQFPVEYVVGTDNSTSSIADVKAHALRAGYYDLRGARVANPSGGLFIRVENGKATKVYVK